MKLIFKQQQYQTDATIAVVKCFEGQSKGYRKEVVGRKMVDNVSGARSLILVKRSQGY
jgi:type III restriction enzyme